MRFSAGLALAVTFSSCTGADRAPRADTSDSAAPADSVVLSRSTPDAPSAPKDPLDALLDTILPARPALLAAGDTVESFGGSMLDEKYAVAYYRRNAAQFFRVDQILGHRPDGKALWKKIVHVSIPVLAKGEQFMHGGMCGTGDKGEPYVLAVVATNAEEVQWKKVSRAWRFDPATETVKEIDPKQVTCWNPGDA